MKYYILFLAILICVSCGDSIKFEEPQPQDQKNLNTIPKRLRGTYFSNSDSTYLTINKQSIVDWTDIEFITLKDSMDIEIDSTKIVDQSTDYVEVIDGKYNLDIRLVGDSVMVHYSYRDTLFKISNNQIIRRFKGHYFLNYKWSDTNWQVRRLTLVKKRLKFSEVRVPEDIETLEQITEIEEVKSDSGKVIGYKLNPSRKELKKLMNHSFSETKAYTKRE